MITYFMRLLILLPVIVLVYFVYNPSERAATARDEVRKNTVSVLARGLTTSFKKDGVYPSDLRVLETLPADINDYTYKVSKRGDAIVLYARAESLSWKEYCFKETALITYSSNSERTGVVCSNSPTPGPQEFVN